MNGELILHGQQGHIAYPEKSHNPIPELCACLHAFCERSWDQGTELFPATQFQVSNIHAGDGTENMIPGSITAQFNFRFAPCSTAEALQQQVSHWLDQQGYSYELKWRPPAQPFYSAQADFLAACDQAIESVTGRKAKHSTSGGTSDGRFIAPTGCQVVEIGVRNHSIHQANEHIHTEDLTLLQDIYQALISLLLSPS